MPTCRPLFAFSIALAMAAPGEGGERLVLFGGGPRPPAALRRFLEWGGGAGARVLVVPWASSEPAENTAAFLEDLAPHRPGAVTIAPFAPLDGLSRAPSWISTS